MFNCKPSFAKWTEQLGLRHLARRPRNSSKQVGTSNSAFKHLVTDIIRQMTTTTSMRKTFLASHILRMLSTLPHLTRERLGHRSSLLCHLGRCRLRSYQETSAVPVDDHPDRCDKQSVESKSRLGVYTTNISPQVSESGKITDTQALIRSTNLSPQQ